MSEKIKKEDLKNITGGNVPAITYTCKSPKCRKSFTSAKAVYDGFDVYCPYCGAFCKHIGD